MRHLRIANNTICFIHPCTVLTALLLPGFSVADGLSSLHGRADGEGK